MVNWASAQAKVSKSRVQPYGEVQAIASSFVGIPTTTSV